MKLDMKSLGDAAVAIIDGDRGVNYPKKTDFQSSGHCLFLNTSNISKSGFNFAEQDFISEEKDAELRKGKLQRHDIVLTTRGTVGNSAYYDLSIPLDNLRINSGMVILRANPQLLNPYYLYLFLRSDVFYKQTKSHGSGSAQPQLPIGSLRNIKLPHPDLPTQQKIAKVLATLDAKIELNNRINAELEAMAKLLYDYWFVQFDFPMTAAQAAALGQPQLEGQPYKSSGGKMVFNPTLKREIPEEWEAGSISSLSHLNEKVWTDKTAPETLLYVDLANTKNGQILEKRRYHWEEAPSRARRILRAGDTIVGTVRPGNRSFCLISHSDEPLTGSTGFAVLTPSTPSYREFNYLSLTSDTNITRLETLASGAAYPAVNPEVVASANMAMPPASLIESFHEKTAKQFELIENHQKQNQELTTLRDWLLPMLMNGQVAVKG